MGGGAAMHSVGALGCALLAGVFVRPATEAHAENGTTYDEVRAEGIPCDTVCSGMLVRFS
jgi:hypothetical protein